MHKVIKPRKLSAAKTITNIMKHAKELALIKYSNLQTDLIVGSFGFIFESTNRKRRPHFMQLTLQLQSEGTETFSLSPPKLFLPSRKVM